MASPPFRRPLGGQEETKLAKFMNRIRTAQQANELSALRKQRLETLPHWQWQHNVDICAICEEKVATNHYTCKGKCGQKKCRKFFSQYFASNDTLHGRQECDQCADEKRKEAAKQQDAARTDFCPKCGQRVEITKAQGTMHLKHKRADGKPCRYKATVIEWKIKR